MKMEAKVVVSRTQNELYQQNKVLGTRVVLVL